MDKTEAIRLLGGSISSAARACGVTSSAVSQWPDELTHPYLSTVQAALYRIKHKLPHPEPRTRKPKAVQ